MGAVSAILITIGAGRFKWAVLKAVALLLPVLLNQGVDLVWLAMLITVNLQSQVAVWLPKAIGWCWRR